MYKLPWIFEMILCMILWIYKKACRCRQFALINVYLIIKIDAISHFNEVLGFKVDKIGGLEGTDKIIKVYEDTITFISFI